MIERRKDKRIDEENRVIIEFAKPESVGDLWTINAFTRDISLGGARILTDTSFSVDSNISMTMFLSKSKQVVRVRGKIKWVKNVDEGLYEMGVEFNHEIPNALIVLINHLYRKDQPISTAVHA